MHILATYSSVLSVSILYCCYVTVTSLHLLYTHYNSLKMFKLCLSFILQFGLDSNVNV